MKNFNLRSRQVACLLLVVSILVYGIDYLFTGSFRPIAEGFLGNFAFLPVYVLIVTLIIERVFRERERLAIRQKLNMVIGVFFSEVGTDLLRIFTSFIDDPTELRKRLNVTASWGRREFAEATGFLAAHDLRVDIRHADLPHLKEFLIGKRGFMLMLLENPNLLEHDDFTDLLWAVFHLVEELEARASLATLPPNDQEHLAGDIRRALRYLLREWVVYVHHLKEDYPYLFSLAVRMNPMNPQARAEIY